MLCLIDKHMLVRPFYFTYQIMLMIEKFTTEDENEVQESKRLSTFKRKLYSTKGRLARLFGNDFNTINVASVVILAIGLPLTMTVAGLWHQNECPLEPKIPIYLYIGGLTTLFILLFSIFSGVFANYYQKNKSKFNERVVFLNGVIVTCVTLFEFIWFILGNIWVFGNFYPEYHDHHSPKYCDKLLYTLAFGIIVFSYLFSILTCLISYACRRVDDKVYSSEE